MATISEALSIAVEHYQAGRLNESEQIYEQILAVDPELVDVLHRLGVIAFQLGKHESALRYFSRAIELNGNEPALHSNLGTVFYVKGNLDEAVSSYRRALELRPDNAVDLYNLGAAFKALGKLDEVAAYLRRALTISPDYADAHNLLGNALKAQGKPDEAVKCFRCALEINSDDAKAHNNLGTALQAQKKLNDAVAAYSRALELKPDFAEAHNNWGTVLQAQRKFDAAVAAYCRAVELKPDFAEAHFNLGTTFYEQEKFSEAAVAFCRALELKPNYVEAHYGLGNSLSKQDKLDEAVAAYHQALKRKPDYPEAHLNLGFGFHHMLRMDDASRHYDRAIQLETDYAEAHFARATLRLLQGDFERGMTEYEWRWKTGQLTDRSFCQPKWDGSPLDERTILLHAEQGFGDTFQFVRYAAVVKQQNPSATVVVECQPPLAKLLAGCPGVDRLIARDDPIPAFDVHVPLVSLPRVFETTLETIPSTVPYQFADETLVAKWRERLRQFEGLKIGINWQGRSGKGDFRKRDIPLEKFGGLAQLPEVSLISLQKGAQPDELRSIGIWEPGEDWDTTAGAFMDTAAIMKNLDLVISSDTSVPHLAGALGVPVWVALPYMPDWRWLLDRSDSPWYPTIRLFRQRKPGDWTGVFEEIEAALVALQNGAR